MPNKTPTFTSSAVHEGTPTSVEKKHSPTLENKATTIQSGKERKLAIQTLQTTEDKRQTSTEGGGKKQQASLRLQKTQRTEKERTLRTPKVAGKGAAKTERATPTPKTTVTPTPKAGFTPTTERATMTDQTTKTNITKMQAQEESKNPLSQNVVQKSPAVPKTAVPTPLPQPSNHAQPTPPVNSAMQPPNDASKSMPVMTPNQLLMYQQSHPDMANTDTTAVSDRSYNKVLHLPAEKKEEYVKEDPRKTIKQLTDQLFVREAIFPSKNNTLQSYGLDKYTKIDQSMLMGEFFNYDDSGYWRILGMRPRRTVGPCIEYDVQRLRNKDKKQCAFEGTEHIMKLCDSDSLKDHLLFLQQYVFIKEFRETFFGHPQRYRFPELVGTGAFDQLCYKDNSNDDDNAKLFMLFPRPNPRPYFIVEKQGPTIEDLLHANQFGILDVSSARFIAIGCIQTLRLMHELGYVHRCVSNYTFGLRLKDGFLPDVEISFNVVCKDAGFVRKFRSSRHPPRRVAPFAGTYKYCSINAMENKEQLPNDDLISVLYLFVEMVHGKLPWFSTRNLQKIKKMKSQLQTEPPIVVDNTGEEKIAIDLRYLPRAFKLLETFNPFRREQYTTYRDVCTVLNLVAESNRHTLTENYIELDKPPQEMK